MDEPKWQALGLAAVLGSVLAVGIWSAWTLRMNHDVAWFLYVAGRLLEGDRLYVDIVEANPPLIVWLCMLPVATARALGVSAELAFRLFASGLLVCSLLLSARVARAALLADPLLRKALLIVSSVGLVTLPTSQFGQREHLIYAFLLPYVFLVISRGLERPISPVCAVLAGLGVGFGVCVKPYFIAVPLLLEAYLALAPSAPRWRPWRRPELVTAGAVIAAGAAWVVVFAPEYLSIAKVVARLYGGMERSWVTVLTHPAVISMSLAFIVLYWQRGTTSPSRVARSVILILLSACLAVAVVQKKGWPNHWYPGLATSFLAVSIVAVEFLRHGSRRRPMGIALSLVLLLVPAARAILDVPAQPEQPELQQIVIRQMKARGIAILSTFLGDAFPLVNETGLRWTLRFPSLWFVPGFYSERPRPGTPFPYRPVARQDELERALGNAVIEDLERERPDLLVLDEGPIMFGFGWTSFSFLDYFSGHDAFRRLIGEYEPLARVSHYSVYKRR